MEQMYEGTCLCAKAKDKAFLEAETSHASALPFCSKKVQVLTENLCFLSGYKLKLQFDLNSFFQPKGFYDFSPKSDLSASSFKQFLHRKNMLLGEQSRCQQQAKN